MRKLILKVIGCLTAIILLSGCAASAPNETEGTDALNMTENTDAPQQEMPIQNNSVQDNAMKVIWLLSNRDEETGSRTFLFTYDTMGRIIRYEESNTNNPVIYYTYDDGSLTKQFLAANEEGTAPESRTVLEQTFRALVGDHSEENIQYNIIHIDTNGFPVSNMCLDTELNVEWTIYYTYDDLGNCINELTVYDDHVFEVEGIYDEHGNQITRKTYDSAENISTISQRKFDENGHILYRDKYQYSGIYEQVAQKEPVSYREYLYNADGKRTEETEYNAQGEPVLTLYYQYDDVGNISRRTFYYHTSGGSVPWRHSNQAFLVSDSQAQMLYRLYNDVIGFVLFNITDTSTFEIN